MYSQALVITTLERSLLSLGPGPSFPPNSQPGAVEVQDLPGGLQRRHQTAQGRPDPKSRVRGWGVVDDESNIISCVSEPPFFAFSCQEGGQGAPACRWHAQGRAGVRMVAMGVVKRAEGGADVRTVGQVGPTLVLVQRSSTGAREAVTVVHPISLLRLSLLRLLDSNFPGNSLWA